MYGPISEYGSIHEVSEASECTQASWCLLTLGVLWLGLALTLTGLTPKLLTLRPVGRVILRF